MVKGKRADILDESSRIRMGIVLRGICDRWGGVAALARQLGISLKTLENYLPRQDGSPGPSIPKIVSLDALASAWRRGAQAQHLLSYVREGILPSEGDPDLSDFLSDHLIWRQDFELLGISRLALAELDLRNIESLPPKRPLSLRTQLGIGQVVRELSDRCGGVVALSEATGIASCSLENYFPRADGRPGVSVPKLATMDVIADIWRPGARAQHLLFYVREGVLPGDVLHPLDLFHRQQLEWRDDLGVLKIGRMALTELESRSFAPTPKEKKPRLLTIGGC